MLIILTILGHSWRQGLYCKLTVTISYFLHGTFLLDLLTYVYSLLNI